MANTNVTMIKDTRKGFDRLAPFYDLMLKVSSGNSILRSQTILLESLPPLNKVLILGGGTGSFLIELLEQKNISAIVYVDRSEKMISETKKKIKNKSPQSYSKIQFVHGTIDDLALEAFFDAVFTNYFLDLFHTEELKRILKKTHAHLHPQGYWYVTDFSHLKENHSGIRKLIYKSVHWLLYSFFRILCGISADTIPDIKAELENLRMKKLEERYTLSRLLWCGIYERGED